MSTKAQTVKIYTTTTCPWCEKTKEFFKEHGVKYKEINVEEPEAAQEMVEKTGQMAVPVTEIDGQFVVGFDERKLRELLHIK
jgi:glutaredoxin-like YruB-family protein